MVLFLYLSALIPLIVGAAATAFAACRLDRGTKLSTRWVAARRHWQVTGVLAATTMGVTIGSLGLAAVTWTGTNGPLVVAVAPMVGAGVAMAILIVGHWSWPRPQGAVRSAFLAPRYLRFLVNRVWLLVAAASVVAFASFVIWAGVTADSSRRRLEVSDDASWARPAFPGFFYGVPQLLGMAALLLLVWVTLITCVVRPAVLEADPVLDERLRIHGGNRALRFLAATAWVCLSGDSYVAANAALGVHSPHNLLLNSRALFDLSVLSGVLVLIILLSPVSQLVFFGKISANTGIDPQPAATS